MFNRQDLLKSFIYQQEKILFAKVLDNVEICAKKHISTFTDFLDPVKIEQYINKLCLIKGINYKLFGGYDDAERKIIGFYDDYFDIDEFHFPIKTIKIKLLNKFQNNSSHRQFLGSILNTGIERSKLGDIVLIEDYALAFVYENIADYICTNLIKVANSNVENSIITLSQVQLPDKKFKEINVTVSSLRLDSIISSVFHISRGKASDFINSEKVSINWSIIKNNSFLLKKDDIFSLRGYGKAKLIEILGKTRKDRIALVVYLYI